MLDDLREIANEPPEFEDQEGFSSFDDFGDFEENQGAARRRLTLPKINFKLGLTPAQRFVLAFLLFAMTFTLGSFCLILTGRVVP